MNILYFTRNMGIGGTEKVILQLCKSLNSEFNKIIVCSSGGENVEELSKLGIKHYTIEDIENKNPFRIILNVVKLRNIINKEKIDVVHTHHRMAALYIRILKKYNDFKFIHTAHNTFYNKRKLTKFALDKSNIIAVGKNVKLNLIEEFNIDDSKINVIYNSIEPEDKNIKMVEEIYKAKESGYFTVGNIGRICEQKGMEYYIEAIKEIIKTNNSIKFFIVGDGEDRLKIESLINQYGLEKYIILLGYRNDVLNIMKQLDLIVLSSLWEGLPLTPIEAFSVGKTVVGTNVDGTPEIIKDGINGMLIEPRDYQNLARKILEIFNNKDLLNKLELNSKKTYDDNFSYDAFRKNYINYYKNIVS
ncbi:glycosyltransferase family 4 protein [Paraclostridium bifermentans]|uniref:glycosyltransferase family 4 protein n=1 Tax=Paraclostridium bifermentans TaxID=1490 RepID=UPI0003F72C91|nr:glycosyltransferase family 4 protein [Paraclostridium bifermentans]